MHTDPRKRLVMVRKKTALVLSGGGSRGAYQAGVWHALQDLGIKIDMVFGTSVGAIGALFFGMDDPALAEKLWSAIGFSTVLYRPDDEKQSYIKSLIDRMKSGDDIFELRDLSGLSSAAIEEAPFSQNNLRRLLYKYADFDRIQKIGRKLYACAYNIDENRPEYMLISDMSKEDAIEAVLASCAIPYIYPPVIINGKRYADGGINNKNYQRKNADNTPTKPLESENYDYLIVVHLYLSFKLFLVKEESKGMIIGFSYNFYLPGFN